MKYMLYIILAAALAGGFLLARLARAPVQQEGAGTAAPGASSGALQEQQRPVEVPGNHEPEEHTDPPQHVDPPGR